MNLINLFNIDELSKIMLGVIVIIFTIIFGFCRKYLKYESNYRNFLANFFLLFCSLSILVCSDNLLLFLFSYLLSNLILVKLMVHNPKWISAKNSGIMARKNFIFSSALLAIAFALLINLHQSFSLKTIIAASNSSLTTNIALALIIVAAMMQSAIFPFHKWLLSSLNSPTPVSALMHGGLINGGGFLIVRFSNIFADSAGLLNVIFIVGFISCMIGTIFKLVQSDIKRMLACSTMAQMGFMFMQCGLGLFGAAIAHLVYHGFFKSYLFLASANVVNDSRMDLKYPPKNSTFFLAILCAILASYFFTLANENKFLAADSSLFLTIIAAIGGAQLSLAILKNRPFQNLAAAILITSSAGWFYGFNVNLIENFLSHNHISSPIEINYLHIGALVIFVTMWLSLIFMRSPLYLKNIPNLVTKLYINLVNLSQPARQTLTPNRNNYKS